VITEIELRELYETNRPIFHKWGEYVTSHLCEKIAQQNPGTHIDVFLKIPATHRVKDTESFISKALYRDKGYANPYEDITDKVGVRFVVLLQEDIEMIKNIIKNAGFWSCEETRDFEKERLENPTMFIYQSVHFVVKNTNEITIDNIQIPPQTPCEIQVRTLLQHAYSELTHDTIYKPKTRVDPLAHRLVARSMALIETTDDIFSNVNRTLGKMAEEMTNTLQELLQLYSVKVSQDVMRENEPKFNQFILDSIKPLLDSIKVEDVKTFLDANTFITDNVKLRRNTSFIFKQPIVLLLYYLAKIQQVKLKDNFPLPVSNIQTIYTDLGISMSVVN
jgi:putative GTP pyrophosphokinase